MPKKVMDENLRAIKQLRKKVVKKVFRYRDNVLLIEFDHGNNLFIDSENIPINISIT